MSGILAARRSPIVWFALIGCVEFTLDPIDPDGPPPVVVARVERFEQVPLPAVDLLFVVDGTPSMTAERAALAAAVPELTSTLDGFALDWQLGVVSASVEGPFPGWLRGSPYLLTSLSPDVEAAFAQRLPTDDLVGESGLAAATAALEQAGASGANAGFFRQGARLQVVFASDDDDDSPGLDPVADFLAALDAFAGPLGSAAAVVGDVPNGCSSANGSARAGTRYVEAAMATGGAIGSVCSIGFEALFADLGFDSVELPSSFVLEALGAREGLEVGNMVVTIDGLTVDGWTLIGDQVHFVEAPPAGSIIEVRYVLRERM